MGTTVAVRQKYELPRTEKIMAEDAFVRLEKKKMAMLDGKLQFIYTASAPFPVVKIHLLNLLVIFTKTELS